MNITTSQNDPELKVWIDETLKKGVYELVDLGVFDEFLVEAKPAWILPHALLIGKIRDKGSNVSTRWFICGDCVTLHTPEEMASSPREAARHFALMWQASLGENVELGSDEQKQATQQAESLYALSETKELWQTS